MSRNVFSTASLPGIAMLAAMVLPSPSVADVVDVLIPFETADGDVGRLEFSYESSVVPFFEQDRGPESRQTVSAAAFLSFELYLNDVLVSSGVDSDSRFGIRDFGDVFGVDDFLLDPAFGGPNAAASVQVIDDTATALDDGVNPLPSAIDGSSFNRGMFSLDGNHSFTEFTVIGAEEVPVSETPLVPDAYSFTTGPLSQSTDPALAGLLSGLSVSGTFLYDSSRPRFDVADAPGTESIYPFGSTSLSGSIDGMRFSDSTGVVIVGDDSYEPLGLTDILVFVPEPAMPPIPDFAGFEVGGFRLANVRLFWIEGVLGAPDFLPNQDLPADLPAFAGRLALDFVSIADPGVTAFAFFDGLTVAKTSGPIPEMNESGAFAGAKAVSVGGARYDLELAEGTCIGLFFNCFNPAYSFTFIGLINARGATSALESVLSNAGFENDPTSIVGCEDTVTHCDILTPHGYSSSHADSSVVRVDPDEPFGTVTVDASLYTTTDTTDAPDLVYAKWHRAGADSDRDGIEDSIDGTYTGVFNDQSEVYSDDFTDQHLGGTTFGTIIDRGGQVVRVTDNLRFGTNFVQLGVHLTMEGAFGAAVVQTCSSPSTDVVLTDGDELIATCGSFLGDTLKGPVAVTVGDDIDVIIPTTGTALIEELPGARVSVANVGDTGAASISVADDGESVDLAPGDPALLLAIEAVVSIDVIPRNRWNLVNPRSRGIIAVAIHSTDSSDEGFPEFDARDIARWTVRFGPSEAAPWFAFPADVDRDGDRDAVFVFKIRDTGIECGQSAAILTGSTKEGALFSGADRIRTISCGGRWRH